MKPRAAWASRERLRLHRRSPMRFSTLPACAYARFPSTQTSLKPEDMEVAEHLMNLTSRVKKAKANHDTIEVAREWLDEYGRIALATVISTWGSAPVPVGDRWS